MEPDDLLLCSEQPDTDESSPCPSILFLLRSNVIASCRYSGFLHVFPTIIVHAPYPYPAGFGHPDIIW